MTDGSKYKTRSTLGKEGHHLKLDIDPKTHPAWTGQHRIVDSGGQVARFTKIWQIGNLIFLFYYRLCCR